MLVPRRAVRRCLGALGAAVMAAGLVGCGDDSDARPPASSAVAPASTDAPPSSTEGTTTTAAEPPPVRPGEPPRPLAVEVVRRLPHDPDAFTQGLEVHEGELYESTGLYGESEVRVVDLETGTPVEAVQLDDRFFGEGLTLVGDTVVTLTWREGTALVWDAGTLEPIGEHRYEGEGWGLCHDGTRLVMSDGSDVLTFRDARSFEPLGQVAVTMAGEPVTELNELECVDGSVWANVWRTDRIVRIDPASGAVTGVLDASGLLSEEERRSADVLNGIAHLPERGTFLLTGKLWPAMFEVEISEAP